ncbi:MAG: phosphoribosylformylglycinamidine synthase subunit PurQ [Alphaproteobacteria bacterium]
MKSAVIVFPGSNCDRDAQTALRRTGRNAPQMVWHTQTHLPKVDLIVVPGGFTYGDYLRVGAMAAKAPIMREVVARARAGTAVLGICNGFQILTECGLLPGALIRNASLKFICRDVFVKIVRDDTPFMAHYKAGAVMRLPVAHHDGNYFADDQTLARLHGENRIALTYCTKEGKKSAAANPNGSCDAIAGIYNETGNVLGLMPHPERAIDTGQGSDDGGQGSDDGRAMFESLAVALQ